MIPFNPQLAHLAPYPPGKPIEEVQRELGLERVIKLASNENPLGPSPRALDALRAHAGELQLYPDGAAHRLRSAVAAHLDIDPARLIFGNGSDEILLLLALAYLGPGSQMIQSQYAFVRPSMHAALTGAETKEIPVIPRHFEQDVEAMAYSAGPKTRMVYLANPNNPTGDMVNGDRVKALLEHLPESCLFVLDEAYHEYCRDEPHCERALEWIEDHPNLVVCRTFSKAYGLAGLRCGYAVAHPEVIQTLERVRPPFNVSRAAQEAAIAALEDHEHLARTIETNRRGMAQLIEGLRGAKVDLTPSHGNFLLMDVRRPAQAVFQALLRRGVIVRPQHGAGLLTHLRVSIGTGEENALFLSALRGVLAEMAEGRV
ncbi:MAG: histidinol-phosphate transaminase [Candidatus Sumerlaeia bacterium]|nr:histidinol-phosphate transaminase [Candidatus Sumerlaeia bacterium]